MVSLWQKTLFYLGLVDDEQIDMAEEAPHDSQTQVRTVDPPRRPRGVPAQSPVMAPSPLAPSVGGETRTLRPPSVVAGRRVEPPAAVRRRVSDNVEHAEAGVLIRASGMASQGARRDETEIIPARTLSDAQTLADHIRSGRPVVLDLRDTESAMVRRLVDFSSGLTYALDGRMVKIAKGVILVTPAGTVIPAQEQRRLADLGLYTAAIGN